jgi:orotate phosphoribosyltransferase
MNLEQHRTEADRAATEYKREWVRDAIEHRGIWRAVPGTRIPAKAEGKYYTWQFYLRRCMYDPAFIGAAADLLVSQLESRAVQIGACEDAGVVLGMAMAQRLGTPMFSIKKKPKAYGLGNRLEGPVTGLPVLLVDDLAGSQATLRSSRQLLEMLGIEVATEYATLVNKTAGTHDTYLDDMKLLSLFTCDDFKLTWEDYVAEYNRSPEFGRSY